MPNATYNTILFLVKKSDSTDRIKDMWLNSNRSGERHRNTWGSTMGQSWWRSLWKRKELSSRQQHLTHHHKTGSWNISTERYSNWYTPCWFRRTYHHFFGMRLHGMQPTYEIEHQPEPWRAWLHTRHGLGRNQMSAISVNLVVTSGCLTKPWTSRNWHLDRERWYLWGLRMDQRRFGIGIGQRGG